MVENETMVLFLPHNHQKTLIEVNEAFAVTNLAAEKEIGFERDITNIIVRLMSKNDFFVFWKVFSINLLNFHLFSMSKA